MTVSLGGITLSEDLELNGVINNPNVLAQINQTLGGNIVIDGLTMFSGKELVLGSTSSANSFSGFFIKEQVDQLAVFRDTLQTLELIHHLGVFSVIITEIELQVVNERVDPDSSTWYIGTVTMIEI